MYHDKEYESWEEAKDEYLSKRKLDASVESDAKKAKKVKIEQTETTDNTGLRVNADEKAKDVNIKKLERIIKIKEDLDTKKAVVEAYGLQMQHERFGDIISKHWLVKNRETNANLNLIISDLALVIQEKKAENITALFAQSAEVKTEVMDCMKKGGRQIQNACAELQVEIVEKEGGGFDVKTKEKDGPQDAPAVGPRKKSGAATARL